MKTFKTAKLPLLATLLLGSQLALADASLMGSVIDQSSILPGATVTVAETGARVQSDERGQFILKGLQPGTYNLKITYVGYEPLQTTVTVMADERKDLGALKVIFSGAGLEEVVAIGHIFQGEMKALNTQKNSNRILNAISADGMGKLPDRNAAEAVQRIPGVSIERDQGEGRFVAVRGLPAQWSSASLNGDRIPTAEEETTSRATAFDFFPTEMIESVEVSKAVTPDMEGDAIGGNVNFITRRAPQETTLDVTVGTNYNDKAGDSGYNLNILAGDRSDDGKWGYIVNASQYVRNWATDNFEPRRSGEGIKRLELRDYTGERDTRGFNGALEYKFDNGDTVYARTLYGTLIDDETHYKHRYRFDKDRIELQHIHNILTTELSGHQLGGEHWVGEGGLLEWKASTYDNHFYYGDVPNSKDKSYFVARFDQKNVGFVGLDNRSGKNLSYNTIDGGNSPASEPSTHLPDGFSMDPTQMALSSIELYKVDVREKDKVVAQLDFTQDMNYDLQLKFGTKYREKERVARFSDEFYQWKDSATTPLLSDFDLSDQPGRNDYLEEINAGYADDFSQVADMSDLENFWNKNRDQFELIDGESYTVANGGALGRNFDVNETQMAGYGMATYQLNDDVSLVGGVRVERTETEVSGYSAEDNAGTLVIVPVKKTKSYTSVLPSVHMTYALSDDSNLRAAFSRTFARPDFGSLAPGQAYSEADGELVVGNPGLNPTYSNNLDVLFERYYDNVGVISGGLFYKQISDPIFSKRSEVTFKGETVDRVDSVNGDNAWLAGAEFAFSRRLDFIADALENVGVQANYTRMRSVMELTNGRKADIPRQADSLYNAALFYDDSTFAVRIAVNHKGAYIQEHGDSSDEDSYYGDYTSVDLSASYQATSDLMVYADINNITNEPMKYYLGSERRPLQVEYYGYRANLGVKYSFF
jgi:TonB-dependent receptor